MFKRSYDEVELNAEIRGVCLSSKLSDLVIYILFNHFQLLFKLNYAFQSKERCEKLKCMQNLGKRNEVHEFCLLGFNSIFKLTLS